MDGILAIASSHGTVLTLQTGKCSKMLCAKTVKSLPNPKCGEKKTRAESSI